MVNGVVYLRDWTVSYISWNATSPSAEDRLTVSQRSVQEGCRLQRHRNESARGVQPSQSVVVREPLSTCQGVTYFEPGREMGYENLDKHTPQRRRRTWLTRPATPTPATTPA